MFCWKQQQSSHDTQNLFILFLAIWYCWFILDKSTYFHHPRDKSDCCSSCCCDVCPSTKTILCDKQTTTIMQKHKPLKKRDMRSRQLSRPLVSMKIDRMIHRLTVTMIQEYSESISFSSLVLIVKILCVVIMPSPIQKPLSGKRWVQSLPRRPHRCYVPTLE